MRSSRLFLSLGAAAIAGASASEALAANACCLQDGSCVITYTTAALCNAAGGTFLGAAATCPAGLCWGEHEPNSGSRADAANNAAPVLASGDSIAGTATGAGFDSGGNGNGTASNGFVDFWLVKTPAAAPAIYRHTIAQTQGSSAQNWTIRGSTQAGGVAATGGNNGVQASVSSTTRTLAWYGFGKQEQVVLETASGSTTAYAYKLTDTVVAPTVAPGTIYSGAVTIRVINSGTNLIDSDTWLYDSNFDAIASDANGPGGYDGQQNPGTDPANTTTSFTRTLAPGTYYLAVGAVNLANNQPNVAAEASTKVVVDSPGLVVCSLMNAPAASVFAASVQLTDASGNPTVISPDINWALASSGVVNFVEFTVIADPTPGECCNANTCSVTTHSACTGAWTTGGSCNPGPCVAPSGSCCIAGSCSISTQANCSGGVWSLNGSCTPSPCTAQCCVADGACSVVTQANCAGSWTPGASACDPNPCLQPLGTCCFNSTGQCSFSYTGTCIGSVVFNASLTCTPNPCAAIGTCCNTSTGACVLIYGGTCSSGTAPGAGSTCDASACPATGTCCSTSSGACALTYGAVCGAGTVAGSGVVCDASACVALNTCCNNTSGICTVSYSGICGTNTSPNASLTCSPTPCTASGTCCSSLGTCSVVYGGAACASNLFMGVGTVCDTTTCPVVGVCCSDASGLCTLLYGGLCPAGTTLGTGTLCVPIPCITGACCAAAGTCTVRTQIGCTAGTYQGDGTSCTPNICPQPVGACCQTAGTCTSSSVADCTTSAGTHLGTGVACPAGMCFGEIEPNSADATYADGAANAAAVLSSGDSIAGIATGSGFGLGVASIDFWLVKTAPAAPGIYRHEMAQIQGGSGQNWTMRGDGQDAGAMVPSNFAVQQSVAGSAPTRTLVWYGFGKQEQVVLEAASGSSIPYLYQMTDTPVTPTVAAGALVPGAITIRVIDSFFSGIDSDTWLYDSNFNAIVSDASGPGGADGLLATGDPTGTTTSFTRTLTAGTYYLAVSPENLANNQPNVAAEGITANAVGGKMLLHHANSLACSQINSAASYAASVQLMDSASNTVTSPDVTWTGPWNGQVHFVQFTVGSPATGVCCRGSTCSTAFADAAACGAATSTSATGGPVWAFVTSSSICNAGVNSDGTYSGTLTSISSPCCLANYNHNTTLEVQDIFDFLNDWFAGRAIAIPGGDGTSTTGLAVQNIFNFLNAWFAGGCN